VASKNVLKKITCFIKDEQINVLELDPTYFVTRFTKYYYETNKADLFGEKIEKINNEVFDGRHIVSRKNYPLIRKNIVSEIQTMKSRTGFGLQDIIGFIFNINGFHNFPQYGDNLSDFGLFSDEEKTQLIAIVAVKYNVRERWKQIVTEKLDNVPVYLITLDPKLSSNIIDKILNKGIKIVHPKPYHDSMIQLNEFFEIEIPKLMEG